MTAPVVLVEATPRNAVDGTPVSVRLAGGGAIVPYAYGGRHWRAGISALPRSIATLDFDGEQLGGLGITQAIEISWAPSSRKALADLGGLFWDDAPITVYTGPEGPVVPGVLTTGLVLAASSSGGVLKIALADQDADLKRPLLVDRYAGTGGLEGPIEFEGVIKSRAWGRCFNVPGSQLDAASNIWVFGDPRRQWSAFDQVRDKGVPASPATLTVLAWQGSAEATLAALKATAAIEGGGVLCPSIASVKWWTVPAGDLHADIRGEVDGGYVETAPEIASRLAAARSTIPFAAGAIAAAVAARPAACGWRVDTDSATAAGEISELLGGVSLSWVLTDGTIRFRTWDWSPPSRAARSFAVSRTSTIKPVGSRKIGYRRNWSPMARGDLAAVVLATDVTYEDGTPVEALKPAAPGADVTGDNTSKDTNAVYGRPAAQVVSDLDLDGRNWFDLATLTANRDALMLARTTLDGKAMGTAIVDRFAEQSDVNRATAESVTLLAAKVGDNRADFVEFRQVTTAATSASSEALDQLNASVGNLSGSVSDFKSVLVDVDGTITAKAVLGLTEITPGRTVFAGMVSTLTGGVSRMEMLFDSYNLLNPAGASIFFYADPASGGDGRVYMPDVVVNTLDANTVRADNIVSSAVQQTNYTVTPADVPIARGSTVTVAKVSFVKDEASSVLEMTFFGKFWSADDLQFTAAFVVNNAVGYDGGTVNIILDGPNGGSNSQGRATLTPFYVLENMPKGPVTVEVTVYNGETDNVTLIAKTGSYLKVVELKQGAL